VSANARRVLVTGATGFVGSRLVRELLARSWQVRALVRRPERARQVVARGAEIVQGDVLDRASLARALEGCDAAYYLVHSMGRGNRGGFVDRDKRAASNFGAACAAAGVGQIIYLGGLGGERREDSAHLRSRHETALRLREAGVPLTYFRAAMVVGRGSAGFETLIHLVRRLPVMVTPRWLETPTQPIAIDDVVAYLADAIEIEAARGRTIEIGGPDVLTYREMIDRVADALGRRRPPKLRVPVLTPRLSSLWLGLVTPVDTGVARPLIDGLRTDTTVCDPSGMALFGLRPVGFDAAVRAALVEGESPLRRQLALAP
jgi:uncharacterized protein YbjT (DUF2867 family)